MSLRSSLVRVLREPSIVVVEIAWRWVFGASALAVLIFAFHRLQQAVVISAGQQVMLASMSPTQIAEALLEIGKRALPLALRLGVTLVPAICLLWIIASTVGRAYVLNRLPEPSEQHPNWFAIAALNLLRVLSVFTLIGAYFACSYATSLVINSKTPNYPVAVLVFLLLLCAAALLWSFVHWILSLASIYAVRQGLGAVSSADSATMLLRTRGRELIAIASTNATMRAIVALVFTILALLPLALHRWPALVVSFEGGLFLLYCLASDLLLLARLAAYAEAAEATGSPVLN